MVDLKKLVLVSLAAFSLASMTIACTGSLEPTNGGDGDGDGDGDVDAAANTAERMQFTNTVLPLLTSTARNLPACSSCHAGAAVPALFGPNVDMSAAYDTLLGNNQLSSPASGSALLNRGAHTGNALCTGAATPDPYCTEDEISIITSWIDAEIAAGRVN